jgi:hypothetical protein
MSEVIGFPSPRPGSKHEGMNLRDISDLRDAGGTIDTDATRVYGQPYETADGTTVIPVTRQRGAALGVYVIKDGEVTWSPAVDATRVALMGIFVGLVTASLAGAAMIRRPPWPDMHGFVTRRR